MIKSTKKGIFILIEIVSFIIFILLCFGIFYLVGNRNVGTSEEEENNSREVILQYIINDDLNMNVNVSLEKEEMSELYDLVKSLEFGASETKCIIEPIYYLEYDKNKLYLDEACGLAIYNDKQYSVTKGGEDILSFLKNKIDTMNNVYLFKFDQEKQKAEMIEIDDNGKNEIRSVWSKHSKETMTMDLAIFLQYYLYIDGDVIGIDEIDNYVSYNTKSFAGHIMNLNQDMQDVLRKYLKNDNECCSCCPDLKPGEVCIASCCPCSEVSSFSMRDYSNQIETFGSMFNMYKGEEINSKDDAINNAKELWSKYLKFEENEEYPLNYEVAYNKEDDCYLVIALPKDDGILGGGAGIIMKKTGEVVTLWGEN